LDYVEGWYQADAARMDRALHKELAMRQIVNAGNGEEFVNLAKPQMVEATRKSGGHSRPAATWNTKVDVLDVYHEIATVRTECADYIDYLHLDAGGHFRRGSHVSNPSAGSRGRSRAAPQPLPNRHRVAGPAAGRLRGPGGSLFSAFAASTIFGQSATPGVQPWGSCNRR
jgi:hypothetical protein